jgi:pyruvate dehydrogenase E2 component (dihydrolipoamide acetyltransferase)
MPRLSDSMEEGTILRWLKSDGDEVKQGEEIAEIETDKATMTYEADADGVLSIVAEEGSTLGIGELIATIGEDGAPPSKGGDDGDRAEAEDGGEPEDADEAGDADEPEAEDQDQDEDEEESEDGAEQERERPAAERGRDNGAPTSREGDRIKASPVARRVAREEGVDLGALEGSGPGGRIVKADVEAAAQEGGQRAGDEREPEREEEEARPAAAASAAPEARSEPEVSERGTAKGDVRVEELTRTQRTVARRMAESRATIPDFTVQIDVDMERCVALRSELKRIAGEDGVAPSYNDMVVKAAATALREFPRANGAYRDGRFELYSRVNIGVAVAAQDSLVVPTIYDADRRSLGEIAREARKLAARVRDGTVRPPELSGGTFTVSNLGMYGITEFTAVINGPQAAILAAGAMREVPAVRDGRLAVGRVMTLTLVCDHRILYGADAAEFLGRIRELLEEPLAMAL